MATKKLVLPPKPAPRAKTVVKASTSEKPASDLTGLKATSYSIGLSDGTSLRAEGEHADLIFRYLNECEKHCAEHQLVNYLGPTFARFDSDGNQIAQGPAFADIRR